MAGDADLPPGLHFAGVNTLAPDSLSPRARGPGAAERVLARGRRDPQRRRAVDIATWSSYDQFRRLLEVTARLVRRQRRADARRRRRLDRSVDARDDRDAAVARLARSAARDDHRVGRRGLAPVIALEGNEVGADRVGRARMVRRRLRAVPRILRVGGRALLEHPEAVRPARRSRAKKRARATARPRASTASAGSPTTPASTPTYFEARIQILTARLEGLQQTVGDLVSDDDLERVLTRIVVSAARTMSAPIFVLALEAMPAADKHVYAVGIGDDEAERLAAELLAEDTRRRREPSRRRGAVEPAPLRAPRRGQPDRPVLPAGTGRAPGLRAARRGRARLRRRGRGRPPPGRRRRAPCSSCRTRSPRSPRPTRWPRTSPAPSPR